MMPGHIIIAFFIQAMWLKRVECVNPKDLLPQEQFFYVIIWIRAAYLVDDLPFKVNDLVIMGVEMPGQGGFFFIPEFIRVFLIRPYSALVFRNSGLNGT